MLEKNIFTYIFPYILFKVFYFLFFIKIKPNKLVYLFTFPNFKDSNFKIFFPLEIAIIFCTHTNET